MDYLASDLSLVDIIYQILSDSPDSLNVLELINEIVNKKNIGDEEAKIELVNQTYLDITTSAKFVYQGDGIWSTKAKDLESWDKDGYAFIDQAKLIGDDFIDEDEDELEDVSLSDFSIDDYSEDEDDDSLLLDEDEVIGIKPAQNIVQDDEDEDDYDMHTVDENGDYIEEDYEENDFDEENYEDLMDEYEDLMD